MKMLLLHIFLCIGWCASAQPGDFKTTNDLAAYINTHYIDSSEKIYQAYKWVTSNIRYDTKNALATNHGTDRRAVIDVAFAKRRGVCENFAAIFSDVCRLMGFRSVTIDGITKQNGGIDRQGHSWSGVMMDGNWFLFDPTWDAGSTGNFHYFKLHGSDFVATHMPFDPLWQMMNVRINYKEFVTNRYNLNGKPRINYLDSISAYLAADSLQQITSKVERMEHAGITNDVVNLFYRIARGDLEGERQEQQMKWFEMATTLLNKCAEQLNVFIEYRNNRFLPSKPEQEVALMLDGIGSKIQSAMLYLDRVDDSKASLVYGTEPARTQAEKLNVSYLRQKEFLSKYFSTAVADRNKVFYQ